MIKIYTPGGYSGMFRSASIYIDGEYIYSADTYSRKFTGESSSASAIGKISGDRIYGSNWSGLFSSPTAEIVRKGSEIHIYKLPRSAFDMPYLYIINNEIYTSQGLSGITRTPCGYIGHGDVDGGSGKASDFGEIYDVLLGGGSAGKPGGDGPKGSDGDGPGGDGLKGPGGDGPAGGDFSGGDGLTGSGCLWIILAIVLICALISKMVSAAYDMATTPEDLQAVVDEAAIEAAAYEREQCDIQEAQLLDALKAEGMIVNQPDMAPFVEATKAVYDKYVGEGAGMVHPDILARTQEIIASFGE